MPELADGSLFQIEALDPRQNKKAFSCGVEPLDRYLLHQAGQDARSDSAVPFVMLKRGSADIIGYYTLSAFSIDIGDFPEGIVRQLKLPRYPKVPVLLLGRLALDQRYKGQGLGSMLLIHALKQSLQVSQQVGTVAVVTDAKDDDAEAFYQHLGFLRLQENGRRFFLPMKTIRGLFSSSPRSAS